MSAASARLLLPRDVSHAENAPMRGEKKKGNSQSKTVGASNAAVSLATVSRRPRKGYAGIAATKQSRDVDTAPAVEKKP